MSLLFSESGADLEETAEEASVEEQDESTVVEEAEELESESEESEGETEEETEEDEVFMIDGVEYSQEDLQHAKDYKNLQADYTKKTMALADERKQVESKADSLSKLADELEVLVNEDKEINWDELKSDDPDEYIRLKERSESRAKKLGEIRSKTENKEEELTPEEIQQEQAKLIEAFPEWVEKDDNGNVTKVLPKYQQDIDAMAKHAKELGFTDEQLSKINTAPMVKALINSMRQGEKKAKIEISKKRIKSRQAKPAKASSNSQSASLFNVSTKG